MARSKAFLVIDYVAGYFVFGVLYWLVEGSISPLNLLTPGSALDQFTNLAWGAALIAYMVLGTIYLFRGLSDWDVTRPG